MGGRRGQQQGSGTRAKQDALRVGPSIPGRVGLKNPARRARRPRILNRWRAGAGEPAQERVRLSGSCEDALAAAACPASRRRPQGVLQVLAQASPGAAAELPQELSIASKGRSQYLGNGPYQLAVRNRLQHLAGDPFHKGGHPLGLARWTEVAGLTTKSQQILLAAVRTTDAGKAVAIDTTLEKTIDECPLLADGG